MTDGVAILRERAQALAAPLAGARDAAPVQDVLCFELGAERCAIETCFVWRALRDVAITPLPVADPRVLGLFSLQGELLVVFDLAQLLGAAHDATPRPRRLLLLGRERPELAVAVDGFEETQQLSAASWLEPLAGPVRESPFVRGITSDARLVLDGAALLADGRLYIDETTPSTRGDR